jgi:hypothetical protein
MRRQDLAATRLMVFAHTNRFRPEDPQYYAAQPVTLPVATSDTGRLIGAALRALGAIYRPGFRYKKAGVVFLDLIPAAQAQGGLFDAPDNAASKARMRAVAAPKAHQTHPHPDRQTRPRSQARQSSTTRLNARSGPLRTEPYIIARRYTYTPLRARPIKRVCADLKAQSLFVE